MIEGNKVVLRPAATADWDALWMILQQQGVLENIVPNPHEVTQGNLLAALGIAGDMTAKVFTILAAEQVVGLEILARIDPVHRSAIIPCIAIDRRLNGEGLGVDATQALVRYAFRWLGLHRVAYTSIMPLEKAQDRAAKLGAAYEGTSLGVFYQNGKWIDQHRFAFVKED